MTCARANFRAAGWKDGDFEKPLITIAAPYSNSMPCNNQFRDLADILAQEARRLHTASALKSTAPGPSLLRHGWRVGRS